MSEMRKEILDLAEKLIRTKGYNAFSYKDISTPLNIKNAAVHYYFPAKKDIGNAVIDRNRANLQAFAEATRNNPAKDQLLKFIEVYTLSREDSLVCFMGAMGSSFESLPEEMRNELTSASHEIRNWLCGVLEKGLRQNEFSFSESIEEKADCIISSLMASLILNKVTGRDVLKNVIEAILKTT